MLSEHRRGIGVSWNPGPGSKSAASPILPWLFMDLDGTLVPPGGTISQRNIDAIHSYTRAGGRVSVATGRHPLAIRELVSQLGLSTPHIAGNGSVVLEGDRTRLLFGIVDKTAAAARELLARHVPHILYVVSGLYIQSPDVTELHVDLLVGVFHDYIPHRSAPPDPESMFKILCFIHADDRAGDRMIRDMAQQVGLKAVRSSIWFLELVSPGAGKGVAMEVLLGEAGWPISDTVAVGDSENDLTIFREAGEAVAVANAVPEVLAAADRIVASCEDDGVAELIDSLL